MINSNQLKETKVYKKISQFSNSNLFIKSIIISGICVVVFIPIYIYLFIMWLLSPVGFWQHLALAAVSIATLGWLQSILFVLGIIFIIEILKE